MIQALYTQDINSLLIAYKEIQELYSEKDSKYNILQKYRNQENLRRIELYLGLKILSDSINEQLIRIMHI